MKLWAGSHRNGIKAGFTVFPRDGSWKMRTGRGAQTAVDEGLWEEIRILTAHLEAVEVGRRRDPEVGDDTDKEDIVPTDGSDEEGLEMRLFKSVLLASSKPKLEIQNYDSNLSTEVLLD